MDQEIKVEAVLKVRDAEAKDAEALGTYCFSTLPEEQVKAELDFDLEKMKSGEVHRLVVEASGYAIGNIRLEFNKYGAPELAQIEDLAVSPPFRRFRVAAQLVESISKVAKDKGAKTVQIEVERDNTRVIESYQEWGFAERPVVALQKQLVTEEEEEESAVVEEEQTAEDTVAEPVAEEEVEEKVETEKTSEVEPQQQQLDVLGGEE